MKGSLFSFGLASLLILSITTGCQQPTAATPAGETVSGPVRGTINNQNFSTTTALATVSKAKANAYDIELRGSSPTPSVTFTVVATPQTYTVKTFGAGGLAVNAYLGGFDFASFDEGTVVISNVDPSAKQISGKFVAVSTTDKTCSLSGEFTALLP